jgi:pSer/pThr/pTyr-binding forkhead associated (FHA) protein
MKARRLPRSGSSAGGLSSPGGSALARAIWDERELLLNEGEDVLGRDPDLPACLDHPQISRRHARIVLRGRQATLEDLGSRNGTFVGEERIENPASLSDGEVFRLGRHIAGTQYSTRASGWRS